MNRPRIGALVCGVMAVASAVASAQGAASQGPPTVLTLDQAIQYALDHYPTVRAALEQANASAAGVNVARAAYLPRLDSLWQVNRATANNIFGQVLPQSVIPAMSGPVLPSASAESVWGSAAGALFTWEPFDLGLRGATVASAEAALTRARAGEVLTRLDVQHAVGVAYLTVLSTERAVAAAQADFDRRDVLGRTVQALVDNQLRPGAESSRATAERAAAQIRLIQTEQNLILARTTLARLLGAGAANVMVDATLLDIIPPGGVMPGAATAHPLVQVHQAAIDVAKAREQVLARTDLPRVYVQSSVFARGSGASPNGLFDGGASGVGLDRANRAAGLQVQFPNVFDFASLRARRAEAIAFERAEAALYDEALLTVTGQQQAAATMVASARAVAANTPVQLAAAEQSELQARTRYQAGLTSIVEVAEAQGLLAQAEFQDQLARVDVWRALLVQAVAEGDLTPFLTLVRPASRGR